MNPDTNRGPEKPLIPQATKYFQIVIDAHDGEKAT